MAFEIEILHSENIRLIEITCDSMNFHSVYLLSKFIHWNSFEFFFINLNINKQKMEKSEVKNANEKSGMMANWMGKYRH